jgi:hypothetical protein
MTLVAEIKEFIETMFRSILGFWAPVLRTIKNPASTIKKFVITLLELAINFFKVVPQFVAIQYKIEFEPNRFHLSNQAFTVTNTNLVRAPNH